MKKWKIYTIAVTSAFAIFGGAVYAGISYLDGIFNSTQVEAGAPVPTAEELKVNQDAANDFELTRFKFDLRRPESSINAQRVMYNGKETNISLLPQSDRDKALASAISTPEEAARALGKAHVQFNAILGGYNAGWFKTEGYGHSVEAAEQAKDGLFDDRLANMPELYLRMADVIGNEKAAQDLRNVAALVGIGVRKEDLQAFLYAHRIIHNVDSFVINRPDEGEEQYSVAKIAEAIAYIEKNDGKAGA